MRSKGNHVTARRADARDAEVGRRVRSRRLERRMSQTDLADLIGVTFQQVQKYERGTNRIGASRLQGIAEALDVPVTFFFDEVRGPRARQVRSAAGDSVFEFMTKAGVVRLVKAFHKIKSRETRQFLVGVAEKLVER